MTKRVVDFTTEGLVEHDTALSEAELAVEWRSAGGSRRPKLSGYAAVFDVPRMIPGAKNLAEVVRAGAFKSTLEAGGGVVVPGSGVVGAFEHRGNLDPQTQAFRRPELFFGSTRVQRGEGSLQVWEDARGLRFESEPLDSEITRHYMTAIERGVLHGASFLFKPIDAPLVHGASLSTRELRAVELEDVSAVMSPAFPAATVSARAAAISARSVLPLLEGSGLTPAEIERILACDLATHRAHSGTTPRRDDLARRVREIARESLID